MRLDNRSKVIAVSGEGLETDEGKQAVTAWYKGVGGSVEDASGGLAVSFADREAAERVSDHRQMAV